MDRERQGEGRDTSGPTDGGAGRAARRWRWQIFGVTWLAYAGYYLTRKSFSAAKVALGPGTAIGLSKGEMAMIDTAYSIAYAAGQLIFGVAGDRLGPRRVVLWGMMASILAAAAMGCGSTAMVFAVFFCIQGLCQATGWAPLAKNVSQFFPREQRGTVMGLWCTNYAVGGWGATIAAAWVGERWGWRYSFFVPALALLGIWVLFLFLQRERPEDVGLPPVDAPVPAKSLDSDPRSVPEQAQPEGSPGTRVLVMEVLRNRMVLTLGAVYFCLKPARYLFLFWGPQYIHEKLGTGMAASALVGATFELGGPLGALSAGVISDRWFGARRAPVGVICLLALSVLLYTFDDLPAHAPTISAVLFLMGVLVYAADSLLAGTAAVDFGSTRGASTASGFVNGAGSVGQIVGPAIPGLVPVAWGWHGVFAILAGMVLVGALVLIPKWNALPTPPQTSTP